MPCKNMDIRASELVTWLFMPWMHLQVPLVFRIPTESHHPFTLPAPRETSKRRTHISMLTSCGTWHYPAIWFLLLKVFVSAQPISGLKISLSYYCLLLLSKSKA